MKTKAHILVVEDQAIIYKRLKMMLKEHHYAVDDFSPSVEEAINHIHKKRPDLVLLDIDLQGEHNGMYLGKLLQTRYNIPFIYVTDLDDDHTFYESLQTKHADFVSKKDIQLTEEEPIVIQTKPHLDEKRLLRSIQTVLAKQTNTSPLFKEGILGLVDYLENIKEYEKSSITKVPVAYKDIVFFTVKPFQNDLQVEEPTRANYLWFQTKTGNYYFLKTSLKALQKTLPYCFVRINESYIVNIGPGMLTGRINGSRLSIQNKEFAIKATYKEEVQKRLNHFYSE
ncbi:MAG: response regulator [Flavobacteriaceae bacterium]